MFEIFEQGADGLVAFASQAAVVHFDVVVAIPRLALAMPDLNIADAFFEKSPSDQDLPGLDPGTYKLVVDTKSKLGSEKLEQDVRIKADSKILLVTDKPLYQPGQLIHIRALALQAFNLHPAASKDLIFEVEDSKNPATR